MSWVRCIEGKIGMFVSSGDQIITKTGRLTTPVPILKFGKINTGKTIKALEYWLCDNARLEAIARKEDMNIAIFTAELKYAGRLPQASKDCMEEYLFDFDPEFNRNDVPKYIVKRVKQ